MALELARTTQETFAGGMVRTQVPEDIPANAAWDLLNTLIDITGAAYRRGGSTYRTAAAFGTGLRFIWDGWLANGGQQTIIASTAAFGRLKGETVENLGGKGLTSGAPPAVLAGIMYFPGGETWDGEKVGAAAKTAPFYAIVGNRLVAAIGHTVYFSKINTPGTFEATDYHELPGGDETLGLAALRSSCAVFTTGGMWVIAGMDKNLTDATGNVQQSLDLYSSDLVLWGSAGIAAWEGALVIPGSDAVYLVSLGVTSEKSAPFVRISDQIAPLYQEYVKNGYVPGQAVVYRNHYLLPIIGGGKIVDVLVCRLDMGDGTARGSSPHPWTHLMGFGAQVAAITMRQSGPGLAPELLGAVYGSNARVLNLAYFDPSASVRHDADGSTPVWQVVTRSFLTGSNFLANLLVKIRVRYQMYAPDQYKGVLLPHGFGDPALHFEDEAVMKCEIGSATMPKGLSVWGLFRWGLETWGLVSSAGYEQLPGLAPPSVDGKVAHTWFVRRKRRSVRFRLTCETATSQLTLRFIELFVRQDGRV